MTVQMLNIFQQAEHPVLPRASHDERARQEFAKGLKTFVQQGLLPGLGPVFEGRAGPRFARETGNAPATRHDIRKAMLPDPYFQLYAGTNRIAQELLWDSVIDSIERQQEDLNRRAAELSARARAPLETDPDFPTPRYVTALDIHCMPGGYAGETAPGDITAGALYDRGVYLYAMGYMGPMNDDMGRSVANYVRRRLPGFQPTAILDMGCTVGHSTLPYKELFPQAQVTGIDVAGPCVRYAHARAAGLGLDVAFLQRNAEATGFPDASFDLIVSHILLHETSGKAMPRIMAECFRLLKPGGYMIHADLPPFDKVDPFAQFILDNETWYNNEPFWGAMREMDQIALAQSVGFPEPVFDTAPMAVMEFAAADDHYAGAEALADREFTAGEYAPGGGWEVLIARKPL
ncbi:MAG: class I SAM-dependent methyltransferase [Sphingomonadaceae bacterium]